MSRQDEIVNERLRKLKELRAQKINPYPTSYDVKNQAAELQEKFKHLKNGEISKEHAKIAGRIVAIRDIGKIIFVVVQDGSGRIQVNIQEKETPDEVVKFFKKYADAGDFFGFEGTILRTQRGELSVLVKKVELLSKSIFPLPEKWHGIQDDEERYRKRYLDIAMNPEIAKMFVRKAKFWQAIRQFLLNRGFMEVETPVLENTPGGAEAKPFITHHNALNLDVYLRISPELWLKRLMVAGYPKVFEIGRIFRNEGMDSEHLQDYTQMEFYWAYADFNEGMKLVEEMYKSIAHEVFGTLKFKIKGFDIDLGKKWEIYDYVAIIKKMTGINVLKASSNEVESKLHELKVEYEKKGFNLTRGIDSLWKYCRRNISGPGFLINVPVQMEPLAKRSEKNPGVVERFQILLAGSEMGKGFSELNDPLDQENRFREQAELREAGDEEAQMTDNEFVEALKYAMPPTCGFGVSERLFSFLEGKPIRETVLFPLMRPIIAEKSESSKPKKQKGGKK